jgi:hypothetical protein
MESFDTGYEEVFEVGGPVSNFLTSVNEQAFIA